MGRLNQRSTLGACGGLFLACAVLLPLACGARRPPDLPEPRYQEAPLPAWSAAGSGGGGAGGAHATALPPDGAILGSDIWEVEGQWVTDGAPESDQAGEESTNGENSSTGPTESDSVVDPKRD